MKRPSFPKPYAYAHPPVQNVNEIIEKQATFGERAADKVAEIVGSWTFIIVQSALLVMWVILNATALIKHWDPYPFILMNLVMSLEAAFTAPIIMMSQNREATRDRLEAHNDFLINQKAEEEIRAILTRLDAQNEALLEIHQLVAQRQENSAQS